MEVRKCDRTWDDLVTSGNGPYTGTSVLSDSEAANIDLVDKGTVFYSRETEINPKGIDLLVYWKGVYYFAWWYRIAQEKVSYPALSSDMRRASKRQEDLRAFIRRIAPLQQIIGILFLATDPQAYATYDISTIFARLLQLQLGIFLQRVDAHAFIA